jgi:hypothetical protein
VPNWLTLEYIFVMKFRAFLPLVLAMATLPMLAQNRPDAEKKPPLFFLKIAANVASHVQSQSLIGFLAIYIDDQTWKAALQDGDLGPFLKGQEAKPGRSAGCLFTTRKDAAICTYFDGDVPYGVVAVRAGAAGTIDGSDILGGYKPVSKQMLKKGKEDLNFTEGAVTTDDHTPLSAFQISSARKAKN